MKRVVDRLNATVARDTPFDLWRWETDATPGLHVHGPQGKIDEAMDIKSADIVVAVFWHRFGTPTHEADSGTEHELRRATEAWRVRGRPDILVYFCTRAYVLERPADTEQLSRLLEFKNRPEKEWHTARYHTVSEFELRLASDLASCLPGSPAPPPLDASPAGEERVQFNLPMVAGPFVGRENELAAVHELLHAEHSGVVVVPITGMGGVGKSRLAAAYARSHAEAYDVTAWIATQDDGTADLAGLADLLELPGSGLAPIERARAALAWLARTRQRWLLVFDDVASVAQLVGLLPRGGHGHVLATSRDRGLQDPPARPDLGVVDLGALDESAAAAYLRNVAGRPGDADAHELARTLGCLPLALKHVAAYCRHSSTSFAEYRTLFDDLPTARLFDDAVIESGEPTVARTWEVTIATAIDLAAKARDVFHMAAYLAPDGIGKELFGILRKDDSALERMAVMDAFGSLARYCLVDVDDDMVSVHRVVQKTVREECRATGAHQRTFAHALCAVLAGFPSRDAAAEPESWKACERLLPHALALAAAPDVPVPSEIELIELLNRACRYLYCCGDVAQSLKTAELTARLAKRLGADSAGALTARYDRANAYWVAGRLGEAIEAYELLRDDHVRLLGAEHVDTLRTRHNLANAYRTAGRAEDAIAVLEAVLKDREGNPDTAEREVLRTRNSLANAYTDAGRPRDAIAMRRGVLEAREKLLGAVHPHTLNTSHGLAVDLWAAGEAGEALAILEPLTHEQARVAGIDHPDTLTVRHSLAVALQGLERTAEATSILDEVLEAQTARLGARHPDTLETRNTLAFASLRAGRRVEAVIELKRALAGQEQVLGTEHPATCRTRANLVEASVALVCPR